MREMLFFDVDKEYNISVNRSIDLSIFSVILLSAVNKVITQTTRALRETMTINKLIFTLPFSIPSFYLAYRLYKKNFLDQIFNKQLAIMLIISGKTSWCFCSDIGF